MVWSLCLFLDVWRGGRVQLGRSRPNPLYICIRINKPHMVLFLTYFIKRQQAD